MVVEVTYKCDRCGGDVDTHYEHRCPDQAEFDNELADRDRRIDELEDRIRRIEDRLGLVPLDSDPK